MSKIKSFLFLQFLFFSAVPVLAQVDTAWVRRYDGPGNSYDGATALAVDASGNVYVTGVSYDSGGFYPDYATIKYSPGGGTEWVRRYNGPGYSYDYAYALAVDDSGNVYVTGESRDSSGISPDYATIKYSPAGDTVWVRRYDGPGNNSDGAYALAVDGNGNVYVTGSSYDSGGFYPDYATIKYSSTGDTLWVRRYNGPGNGYDYATALAVDASGNVYVTGGSVGSGTSTDYATIKYSPAGDTVWVRRYDGPGNNSDGAYALAVDGNGNVYVTGSSYDSGGFYPDYATIKYSSAGDTVWVRRYNGPGNDFDQAWDLAVNVSGNVYVVGGSVGSGTSTDYATIRYSSAGDTLWVRRYNGPGDFISDRPTALAVDVSGNVYVTGYSDSGGTSWDYATIKYSSAGDTVWVRRYDGPGNNSDEASALAVDTSGNVYVTGRSVGSGTDLDYATIKYRFIPPSPLKQDTIVITAYSPVNLVVTDPKNDSIGLDTTGARPDTIFNTILEGSSYDTTQDVSVPPDGEKDDVVRIPKPYVGEYKIRVVPEDTGHFSLGIRIDGSDQVYLANNVVVPETSTTYDYSVMTTLRGDVNKDTKRNLIDIIFLVNYIFKGGIPPNPIELGNVNCTSGAPNLIDIVYMVNYVFKGGNAPCS